MSGHSKWATTKYRKNAQDKARGKLFAKLIRQIEVCAREGGADLSKNAALRTAFSKARDASVPMETIERAIKRGTGELEGVKYEQVSYEGYGPCGVAIIVECLSDNRNRTGSEIRYIFSRNGGSLAEPGAVSWQFERKGMIRIKSDLSEDELMELTLDYNVEDIEIDDSEYVITCNPSGLNPLREVLEKMPNNQIISAEQVQVAKERISVSSKEDAKKVLKLLDALNDHDDVQNVYDNSDISEDLIDFN